MDIIANMFTAIKNAQKLEKPNIIIPYSKIKENILEILKKEGFISNFQKVDRHQGLYLKIILKYNNHQGAIGEIKRVSKPSRRIYVNNKNIKPILRGMGISIISTSKGVITNQQAKKLGIGGEIICEVW